jgi:IS30 family transposase
MKKYKHLSAEEHAVIMIERTKNASVRAMARLLGHSASTITRELARNHRDSACGYDATSAARAYRKRRNRCAPSSFTALCASALALRAPYAAQTVINARLNLP